MDDASQPDLLRVICNIRPEAIYSAIKTPIWTFDQFWGLHPILQRLKYTCQGGMVYLATYSPELGCLTVFLGCCKRNMSEVGTNGNCSYFWVWARKPQKVARFPENVERCS